MASVAAVTSSKFTGSLLRTTGSSKLSAVSRVQGVPAFKSFSVVCKADKSEVSMAAAGVAISTLVATAYPAFAMVDERLEGEGTGLALGLSDPALGWILFGVFTLIWALYFVFSSSLPEGDDDSGLSL